MPIRVYWEDDSQTIVRYEFEGTWTWEELYPIYYQAIEMETSVPQRVDVILDMRQSGRIPANALTHVKNISDKQPPTSACPSLSPLTALSSASTTSASSFTAR